MKRNKLNEQNIFSSNLRNLLIKGKQFCQKQTNDTPTENLTPFFLVLTLQSINTYN